MTDDVTPRLHMAFNSFTLLLLLNGHEDMTDALLRFAFQSWLQKHSQELMLRCGCTLGDAALHLEAMLGDFWRISGQIDPEPTRRFHRRLHKLFPDYIKE